MPLFAKFKKILRRGLRATLNFQKFKVDRYFIYFALLLVSEIGGLSPTSFQRLSVSETTLISARHSA